MKGIAIIVAAGKGERAGVDKIWMKLGNETTLDPLLPVPTPDGKIIEV